MKLVIVESPGKVKSINKYLGKDYKVVASFGHMRDLPSKNGSVKPEEDFDMVWEVNARGKKIFKEILADVKNATDVCLATDPDREGEAISWHILQMLKAKKVLKDVNVERVTFNEITKSAIQEAFSNPRELNQELIDAYLARRALDYLVGFTLSPLLWRKLPGSRSAGRVQSVALRIICERELEIEAFKPEEYWTIGIDFHGEQKQPFTARLTHLDNNKLTKFSINNKEKADDAVKAIQAQNFAIDKIENKVVRRHPAPPFTTSTLQQEASRKIGMGAKRTMQTAQKLYEGINIGGETTGLITYMRTDGVQMSKEAIGEIRSHIKSGFGQEFLPDAPRIYKSKAKNAQEAHEAIRPTDITRTPEELRNTLDNDQYRLYDLVWKRALASQMASALFDQVVITISSGDTKIQCRATGSILKFAGFLTLYKEGVDDGKEKDDKDRRLPALRENENLDLQKVLPDQHFTEAPPRYSEASLVKKLEELGIGRPSTYATILGVLQDRNYVRLDKKRFYPEERGRLVTTFLTNFFAQYVEYEFTAQMEERLDQVSDGTLDWKEVLRSFWEKFNQKVEDTKEVSITEILETIEKELYAHFFPDDKRQCPKCDDGRLGLKLGKFGAFLGCANYPECKYTKQLTEGEDAEGQSAEGIGDFPKMLGKDPETGLDITVRKGPFGFYIQLGEAEGKKKPKRGPIPKEYDPLTLGLDDGLVLLNLPREVGRHPETKLMISTNFGRFGPYLKYGNIFVSIETEDVLTLGINRAVTLIAEKRPGIIFLGMHPDKNEAVLLYRSKFGYITSCDNLEGRLPKGMNKDEVTLEMALEWLKEKKTAIKKKTTKKKVTKKK
jgi:DNA topoisomerase I